MHKVLARSDLAPHTKGFVSSVAVQFQNGAWLFHQGVVKGEERARMMWDGERRV